MANVARIQRKTSYTDKWSAAQIKWTEDNYVMLSRRILQRKGELVAEGQKPTTFVYSPQDVRHEQRMTSIEYPPWHGKPILPKPSEPGSSGQLPKP